MDFSSFFSDLSAGIVLMIISFLIGGAAGAGGTLFIINKNKHIEKSIQKITQRGGDSNQASIHNK